MPRQPVWVWIQTLPHISSMTSLGLLLIELRSNDKCNVLTRGGSCCLSKSRLLEVRSNTTSLKAGGKWPEDKKKVLKYYMYQRPRNLRTGRKNQSSQFCTGLSLQSASHIQTVLSVSHTVPSSGWREWVFRKYNAFSISHCVALDLLDGNVVFFLCQQETSGNILPDFKIYAYVCVLSRSVVSNSLRPHGLQPARFFCPWGFSSKNTGVGCQAFLPGIFPTQGLNSGLPHCRQILYQLSHKGRYLFIRE